MKKILLIAFVFALGYGYGRWYGKDPTPVAAATTKAAERKVLYYQDPMHPSYTSDKPGKAPDCGMDLEPVYEEEAKPAEPPAPKSAIYVSPDKQQLIGVQYGTTEYATAEVTVRAPGKVELDEAKVARVSTTYGGWAESIDVKLAGTRVRQGQKLLTIYNPQWQQEYRAVMKGRRSDRANDEAGKMEAAKQQLQSVGLSTEELEIVQAARQSNWRLALYAPITGVVLASNVVEKQKLTPDPLYVIADLSSVWVTADVLESDASFVREGQPVTFTLASQGGRKFHGAVDAILPQVDPATRTVKVRVHLANPDDALKPEMFGTLEIRCGGGRKLLVPQEAVLNSGVKQVVFVDRGDGYLEPRAVKAGRHYGDRIEILSGLKAGERVVTSGNFLIDSEAQLRASGGHDR